MMAGRGLVLFSILFLVSDVVSELVDPWPQNKAVANGATGVAFDCTSSTDWKYISWNVLPVGGSTKIISIGSSVVAPYQDTCNLSNTRGHTSTLTIIKAVNESLAGTYSCNEAGVASASAQLIVYNADPVCTSNVNSSLYQGQTVQMSCTFSYTANKANVGVNMMWSFINDSSSYPVQSPPVNTTAGTLTTAVSIITQRVGYSNPFPVYKCKTSFTVTGNTATNAAGNVPDYSNTSQPFNSPITVNYFNPSCSINGAKNDDTVLFGTTISCEVDANPSPSYRWSNETNATLSSEKSVAIMNDGNYTCTASNAVSRCAVSIYLTAYKGLSETNKIIIGVVVGVGGFILLVAIILIVCWCMKKNKSGAKYENGNQDVTQMTSGAYKKMGAEGNLHQKQASTNVSSISQPNSAPKKLDNFPAVDANKVANSKTNEDGLVYADLERESHPSVQSEQSDKKPGGKITDNGNYADIREA